MDRRTILAVVLSLAIYYAWLVFRGPQPDPGAPGEVPEGPTVDVVVPAPAPAAPIAPAEGTPARDVNFTLCDLEGVISTDGGGLRDVTYPREDAPYTVTPLYRYVWGKVTGTIDGPWRPYGEDPGPAQILSEEAAALVVGTGVSDGRLPMRVLSEDPLRPVLSGTTADGVEIERTLSEDRADGFCRIVVETTWRNTGAAPYTGVAWIAIHDHTPAAGSSYESQHQPTALVDGSMVYGGKLGAGCVREGTQLDDERRRIELPGAVDWYGVSDRYFGFYLVPPPELQGSLVLTRIGEAEGALDGGVLSMPLELPPGAARTDRFVAYGGPNHTAALTAVHPELARAVDLGFFALFAWPLLYLLRAFHGFTSNWGLSIILLTLLVKGIFFPMTQRSFVSMQKMQQVQPELQRIKAEFADDPQELNRRTLEVMQKNQVNPVAGCLPIFLQMPVFIALYNVLLTCVELYHTEFLYLRDLASPDPYLVLPVLITFLMWLQQQFSTPAAGMDPVQQQVMRWMPLMFGLFFFASPSGLGVYFFVNTALSILQQWWIKRSAGSSPPPAAAAAGA
jgi:YidC/Oxa1 family membrane protein insertase